MQKKIRVGVFGGYRGDALIHALYGNEDAVLVAVCDRYQPILDKVKKEAEEKNLDVKLFTSFDDFIEYDMDAVILANYATEHATFAVRALNKGKHVLSEVLPCETIAQAVELIETVEKTGLVYAYAENYCYMQHTFEMRHRYEAGEIGEVHYCEGEYIHDCANCWPSLTYGDKNHWRNRIYSTYYCTHSIGPMLTVTGRRPVSVVGFETPLNPDLLGLGSAASTGIEMITLDNGAVCRSIHGGLKREPGSIAYMFYGTKGMMESGRFDAPDTVMNIYKEGDKLCEGAWEHYAPKPRIAAKQVADNPGHAGSDFYPTHFFIEKILGREDGLKYSIDVYHAVDMGLCGIMAYRSILNGNTPMRIPDLRKPSERNLYRNDNACTCPEVAGKDLLPVSSHQIPEIPDEVYEYAKGLWQRGELAEHPYQK